MAVVVGLLVIGLGTPLALAAVGQREKAAEPSTAAETRSPTPDPTPVAAEPFEVSAVMPVRAAARDLRSLARTRATAISKMVAREQARLRAERQAERRAQREAERQAEQGPQRKRRGSTAPATPTASGPMAVRIGSFNVLGSQHTGPSGPRSNYAAASVRTPQAVALIREHGIDILGTQELQADQLRDVQGRTGMAAYPGFGWGEAETDNSILYDSGQFELVSGSQFTIPFMGRPRPQPIVRLRHLASGREFYVVNTHPSAGGGRYATERANGRSTLVGVVNRLKGEGLPVFVTGDMNDREAFYCGAMPPTGMTAPNGGSYGSGCQPPPQPLPVDWVVGHGATWSSYWRDTRPVERRISDHFLISATAQVG